MSLAEELATKYCLVENDGKTPDSYALCAINEALERAAQECERDKGSKHGLMWGKHFASLVRALKDKP